MYVWELVSGRLRADGWDLWHSVRHDACGPIYTVHLRRGGHACETAGPTLTEAYAAAARKARELEGVPRVAVGPHFTLGPTPVRV
jgi:hypothetical protein